MEFFDASDLRLRETAAPALAPEEQRAMGAMDRFWAAALERQPALFDGPAVACLGVGQGPGAVLDLAWARISYRYRALRQLRQVAGASWKPASMFVTVLQPVSSSMGSRLPSRSAGKLAGQPPLTALPPAGQAPDRG